MKKTTNTKLLAKVVNELGGVTAVAALLDISHSAVSGYLSGFRPIPPHRALQIEKITDRKYKATSLLPWLKSYTHEKYWKA